MNNIIVLEIQVNASSASTLPFIFTDRSTAEAKYHEILMYAAASNVEMHSCVMLGPDGFVIKNETYRHPAE